VGDNREPDPSAPYFDDLSDPDDPLPPLMDEELPPLMDEELGALRWDTYAVRRRAPLEDEPSRTVSRYLFPTERFRGEWRRHWWDPVFAIAVSGLASGRALHPVDPRPLRLPGEIAGVSTADVLHWLLIGVAVFAGWRALTWPVWRMVLTNKRVIVVRGLLWRRTTTIPLPAAANTHTSQPPLGMLLVYGSLSFGQTWWRSYRIRRLPNFNEIYLRIMEETYEPAAVEARLPYRSDDYDYDYDYDGM
jgi:Bacterial PH domain